MCTSYLHFQEQAITTSATLFRVFLCVLVMHAFLSRVLVQTFFFTSIFHSQKWSIDRSGVSELRNVKENHIHVLFIIQENVNSREQSQNKIWYVENQSLKHFCSIVPKLSPSFSHNFKSGSQLRPFVLFVKYGEKIANTLYIQYMYIISIWWTCTWEIILLDSFSEKIAAFHYQC